jgi:hypothetical protein
MSVNDLLDYQFYKYPTIMFIAKGTGHGEVSALLPLCFPLCFLCLIMSDSWLQLLRCAVFDLPIGSFSPVPFPCLKQVCTFLMFTLGI